MLSKSEKDKLGRRCGVDRVPITRYRVTGQLDEEQKAQVNEEVRELSERTWETFVRFYQDQTPEAYLTFLRTLRQEMWREVELAEEILGRRVT